MDETQHPVSDATGEPTPGGSEWRIGVRPKCYHCERLAVTHSPEDRPLCSRHARLLLAPRPTSEH